MSNQNFKGMINHVSVRHVFFLKTEFFRVRFIKSLFTFLPADTQQLLVCDYPLRLYAQVHVHVSLPHRYLVPSHFD